MKPFIIFAFLFMPLSLFAQVKAEITFGVNFLFNESLRFETYSENTDGTYFESNESDFYRNSMPSASLAIIYPINNIDLGIKIGYAKATQTKLTYIGEALSINLWPVSLYGQYNFKGANIIPFVNADIGLGLSELGGIGTNYGLGAGMRIKDWIVVGAGYSHLEARESNMPGIIEWTSYDVLYRFNSLKLFAGLRF